MLLQNKRRASFPHHSRHHIGSLQSIFLVPAGGVLTRSSRRRERRRPRPGRARGDSALLRKCRVVHAPGRACGRAPALRRAIRLLCLTLRGWAGFPLVQRRWLLWILLISDLWLFRVSTLSTQVRTQTPARAAVCKKLALCRGPGHRPLKLAGAAGWARCSLLGDARPLPVCHGSSVTRSVPGDARGTASCTAAR